MRIEHSVSFSPEEWSWLVKLANTCGVSVEQLVRSSLLASAEAIGQTHPESPLCLPPARARMVY
jgi:hypothetical protein